MSMNNQNGQGTEKPDLLFGPVCQVLNYFLFPVEGREYDIGRLEAIPTNLMANEYLVKMVEICIAIMKRDGGLSYATLYSEIQSRQAGRSQMDNLLHQIVSDTRYTTSVLDIPLSAIRQLSFVCKARGMLTFAESKAFSEPDNLREILANLQQELDEIFMPEKEPVSLSSLLPGVRQAVEDKINGRLASMSTGFLRLDRIMGVFGGEQMIVLAGRPGMGKTTFAAYIGLHVANTEGNVLMFSQEMNNDDLAKRILASRAQVNFATLYFRNESNPSPQDMRNIDRALGELDCNGSNFWLVDGTRDVNELCAQARQVHRQTPLKLIIIDYLTLTSVQGRCDAYTKANTISESFRNLTKQLKVPVLCLAQMNREIDKRPGKQPMNSDLRDSGKIEQDAHVIMFLSPQDTAKGKKEQIENQGYEDIWVTVTKNRNGKTGKVPLRFWKSQCRFEEKLETVASTHPDPNDVSWG